MQMKEGLHRVPRAAHPAALVETQTASAPLFSFLSGRGCCLLRAVTTAIAIYCHDPRGGCRLMREHAIAWAGRLGASPTAAAVEHWVPSSTGHQGGHPHVPLPQHLQCPLPSLPPVKKTAPTPFSPSQGSYPRGCTAYSRNSTLCARCPSRPVPACPAGSSGAARRDPELPLRSAVPAMRPHAAGPGQLFSRQLPLSS